MDLIKDLSVLTTIPESSLKKLAEKSIYCICHNVDEKLTESEKSCNIDIGIGNLNIIIDSDEIYYRFIPSKSLEKSLKETVIEGKNPLVNVIENTVKDKIVNVYKELF